MKKIIIILFLGIFLFFNTAVNTAIINIPFDYPSIQNGIDAANPTDTILIQAGCYFENIDFSGKNITVASFYLTTHDTSYISQTIIDGNNNDHVVKFISGEDTTSILSGLTIQNGAAQGIFPECCGGGIFCNNNSCPSLLNLIIKNNNAFWAGGLYINNSSPILDHVIIQYNNATLYSGGGLFCSNSSPTLYTIDIIFNTAHSKGGGIYLNNSSPQLYEVSINNNIASTDGGGIYCMNNSSPDLLNVTIDNNSSYCGGGIYCRDNSSLNMYNTIIINNIANADGGGIFCYDSSPTLQNTNIVSNNANNGGGAFLDYYAAMDLDDVIISQNIVTGKGGGIYCNYSSPNFDFVTISNNSAEDVGGGIYLDFYSSPTLENVTIKNNSSNISGGGIYSIWNSISTMEEVTIKNNISHNYGGGIFCGEDSYLSFDTDNRCDIYSNNIGSSKGFGADIFVLNCDIMDIIVDTFTVMNPTDYYASPADSMNFDIFHSIKDSLINADLYVSVTGSNANSGLSYDDPFKTITHALSVIYADSLNHNTIFLATGIYSEATNGEKFPIELGNYISLCGNSKAKDDVILNACFTSPVMELFYVTESLIQNITFQNGSITGGIYLFHSSPHFNNIMIKDNNSQENGGGINCSYSSPILQDVTIKNNNSDNNGGGIFCMYSSPIISNSIIGNNYAKVGGGISCYKASLNMKDVTIKENSSLYGGGGIHYDDDYSSVLENIAITNNNAAYGGGIYCNYSSPIIKNVTISNNNVNDVGNGIYCYNSSPQILNSILSSNYGNYGLYVSSGNPTITYSDFYNNEGGNFFGVNDSIGVNVTINANSDSCDVFYNIQREPCFVDTANGDYHLSADSPCIDAGDPNSPLDPDSTIADMGAYYYNQSSLDAPQNVLVFIQNDSVYIEWDSVSGANSYKVYSSDNPYSGYVEDLTGEFSGTIWEAQITGNKKFYYVTAIK